MNALKNISILLLLVFGIFFTACNKEDVDEVIVTEEPTYEPDNVEVNNLVNALQISNNDGLELGCIIINYPFDMLLTSGATATISSEQDFITIIENEDEDEPVVVNFVFPLTVTDEDGNPQTVADDSELGLLFASCVPDDGWDGTYDDNGETAIPAFILDASCFTFVYPVDLVDIDGNTYTAADESAFIDLLATHDLLFFSMPFSVLTSDGTTLSIDSGDAFFEALINCDNYQTPIDSVDCDVNGLACFELVYPFEVVLEDGTITTVNDENEYADLFLNDSFFEFSYPLTVLLDTNEELVLNSQEELFAAFETYCGFVIIDEPDPCDAPAHIMLLFNQELSLCSYNVQFPIQVLVNDTTIELNDMDDYFDVYSDPLNDISLAYPINITMNDTGATHTLLSDDDVCTLIKDCE